MEAAPPPAGTPAQTASAVSAAVAPRTSLTWAKAGHNLFNAFLIGSGIGLMLSLMLRGELWITLVYSWCIALSCTLCIDGLRWLVAAALSARVHRRARAGGAVADAESHESAMAWIGWRWMAPCLVLGTLAGFLIGSEVAARLTGARNNRLFSEHFSMAAALLLVALLPGVITTMYFRAKARLQAAEALAETARRQATETRLRLLEAQLEPHMLFNTLANLRALIGADPARAQEMLDRLIDFLRATLGGSRAGEHPLADEFARTADYLALMQIRMGERLRVELALPDALRAIPVPALVLQPVVENAIKHGLEPSRRGGSVRVEASHEGGLLCLKVSDTGVGLADAAAAPQPGRGFGLQQVRERLASLYGPAATLDLRAGASSGTEVTLCWPVRSSEPSTLEPAA